MKTLLAALEALQATVAARHDADPASSYTAQLLGDPTRAAKKLGEEAVEVVVAATLRDQDALAAESADLFYHHLVLLAACGVAPSEVAAKLAARTGTSGLEEKASRTPPPPLRGPPPPFHGEG